MTIAIQNLLKNSVRFGHFQLFSGQFDGLIKPSHCEDSKKLIKFFNRIWK